MANTKKGRRRSTAPDANAPAAVSKKAVERPRRPRLSSAPSDLLTTSKPNKAATKRRPPPDSPSTKVKARRVKGRQKQRRLQEGEEMGDEDMDALLERAKEALEERRRREDEETSEKQREKSEKEDREEGDDEVRRDVVAEDGQEGTSPMSGKASRSKIVEVLTKLKLDPGVTAQPYLSERTAPVKAGKRNLAPVRLDTTRIEIVSKDAAGKGAKVGLDQGVAKGLGKAGEKGLVDRIVVERKKEGMPPELDLDEKAKKLLAKKAETAGSAWFGMRAPDLTPDVLRSLHVIRSRAALDPKRHYRKQDKKAPAVPKFFQLGELVNGAADHYSGRLTRRERRQGIVEELLADQGTRTYLKEKMNKLQRARAERYAPYRRPAGRGKDKGKSAPAGKAAKKK
ncbi:hypothetical protein HK101_004391 [Irineochytrium annulatum]|nr:hypothetical protein HK101_004391 [Irineochytrium annulatum]